MTPMSGIGVHVLSIWAKFSGVGENEDNDEEKRRLEVHSRQENMSRA
jgi:hypothetical protein